MAAIISAIILFHCRSSSATRDAFLAGRRSGRVDLDRHPHLRAARASGHRGLPFLLSRDLNLLMVSEDEANALGVRVVLTRNSLLLAASLITGTAVAFSGAIAFVGLIAPHTLRLLIGADHRALIPLSAIGGGIFLLAADTLARVAIAPAEIPVGVVTALVGAPFFVLLLARNKSRASML